MTHDSALPAVPEGMKRWDGGESEPDDWPRFNSLLYRNGETSKGGTDYDWRHLGLPYDIIAYTPRPTEQPAPEGGEREAFQDRVQPWLMACFGEMIAGDREERNHRFLEEALELVQACGCTPSEAHQLVDYVYARPVGAPAQEVGGVMVTLAALCLANSLDMHANGETELARIWTKVEAIRAKQAAKPKHSPLPTLTRSSAAPSEDSASSPDGAVGRVEGALDAIAGLDIQELASAVHDARWDQGRGASSWVPFADEVGSGRIYSLRIANAVQMHLLAALTASSTSGLTDGGNEIVADLYDALQWAMAELRGSTKYTDPQQKSNCLDKAQAILSKAASFTKNAVPFGWVVMNGDGTQYRTWKDGWSAWTDHREEATRYARRQDAEAVHSEDEDAWFIVPLAQPDAGTSGMPDRGEG